MADNTDTQLLADEESSIQYSVSEEPQNDILPINGKEAAKENHLADVGDQGTQTKLEELMEADVLSDLVGMNPTPEDQALIPENDSVNKAEEPVLDLKDFTDNENDGTELQLNEYVTTVGPPSTLPEDLHLRTEDNGVNVEATALMKDLDLCPGLEEAVVEHCSQSKGASSKSVIFSSVGGSLLNINIGCVSSETAEEGAEHIDEDELSSSDFTDCDSQGSNFFNPTDTTLICRSMNQNEDLELDKLVKTMYCNEDELTSLESEAFNSCEDSSLDLGCGMVNTASSESENFDLDVPSEENKVKKLESDVSGCLPFSPLSPQNILPFSSNTQSLDTKVELESSSDSEGYGNNCYEDDKYTVVCSEEFSLRRDVLLNPENAPVVNGSVLLVETEESAHYLDEKNHNYTLCSEVSKAITCQSSSSNEKSVIVDSHLGSAESSEKQTCSLSHDNEQDKQKIISSKDHKHADFILDKEPICGLDHWPMGTFQCSPEDSASHLDSGFFASSDNSLLNSESAEVGNDNVEPENTVIFHNFEQKGDDWQSEVTPSKQCADEKQELSDFTGEEDEYLKPDNYVAHARTESLKAAVVYKGTDLFSPGNAVSDETVHELCPSTEDTHLISKNCGEMEDIVESPHCVENLEKGLCQQEMASTEEQEQSLLSAEDSMLNCENLETEVSHDDEVAYLEPKVSSGSPGLHPEVRVVESDHSDSAQMASEQVSLESCIYSKKEELSETGAPAPLSCCESVLDEHSLSLNLHALAAESEAVKTRAISELQCIHEADASEQLEHLSFSELNSSVISESINLNTTEKSFCEVMENPHLVRTEVALEGTSFYAENYLGATEETELDKQACYVRNDDTSELHEQDLVSSEQKNPSTSDSESSDDGTEFENTDLGTKCEQSESKQTEYVVSSLEHCIYYEEICTLESVPEETPCSESVLHDAIPVNFIDVQSFGEDAELESELHSHSETEQDTGISLIRNADCEDTSLKIAQSEETSCSESVLYDTIPVNFTDVQNSGEDAESEFELHSHSETEHDTGISLIRNADCEDTSLKIAQSEETLCSESVLHDNIPVNFTDVQSSGEDAESESELHSHSETEQDTGISLIRNADCEDTSFKIAQSEETPCSESVLHDNISVNFTDVQSISKDTELEMESELHSHNETEQNASISLFRNADCEGSTFIQNSLMNYENNLSEGLGLQGAEKCDEEYSSATEPAYVSAEDSGSGDYILHCCENGKYYETISALENPKVKESFEPTVMSPNDDISASKDAGYKTEVEATEAREEEKVNDGEEYCLDEIVPLECEIASDKRTVASDIAGNTSYLSVYNTNTAETRGDEKQNCSFAPSPGQECGLTTVEVPFLSMENTSVTQGKKENDELEEMTDCVDFARVPTLHYDNTVLFETAKPGEAEICKNFRQDQEPYEGDKGLQQEQTSVSTAQFLCNDQYISESDETLLATDNCIDNADELKELSDSDFKCDKMALYAETNSTMGNSEGNSVNFKDTNLIVDVLSAEQCHDMASNVQTQESVCPCLISSEVGTVDQKEDSNVNQDKNGNKLSQWNELSPAKQNHIDWEWRYKIMEEEKIKLCEQNKRLQSELQLHLEKETTMSMDLDQLRNRFTESERKIYLLENENLSLVSDCQKMQMQLETPLKACEDVEMLMQYMNEKDREIAELRAQIVQINEQHSREMTDKMMYHEAACNARTSNEEINTLTEQNLSMEGELTSCKEMIDSLNNTLREVTGAHGELLEENKNLNGALDQEKMLNAQLSSNVDLLTNSVADKGVILEDLKNKLVTAENAITSQSDEIKELQTLLNVKENLLTEKVSAVTQLQETANNAKHDADNISSLLRGLVKTICAHESVLSCKIENHSEVNALYCDIEKSEENISQLIKVISAAVDNSTVISNFNMYVTSIQSLLCLQKQLMSCLKATCDVKGNELAEKHNECSILNERFREAILTLQQKNEKLLQVEEDLLCMTTQLQDRDSRFAELDERLLEAETFREDFQNLEKNKEALIAELQQKSNDITALQQQISGLKEMLYQNEQSLEQKSNILFSAEEKVVEMENLMGEKNRVVEAAQKKCQEDENKIEELQSELMEINEAVFQFFDEIHINPEAVDCKSHPADERVETVEDNTGDFITGHPEVEVENKKNSLSVDLEVECAEAKTTDKEMVSDITKLHALIRSGTCSTLNLVKQSFTAIQNKCFNLEHHETLASLENKVKELDSLKATLSNIETISSNFMQEMDNCVKYTLRAFAENTVTVKELCNNLENENCNLKSLLSDKEEGFLMISNELEIIENMIGCDSKERRVDTDHGALCSRVSHIADSLQNINSTSLPEFLRPVLSEMEEALTEILKFHDRTIPHSTLCEKVKLISELMIEFLEKNAAVERALLEKEQQYAALSSLFSDIKEEFNTKPSDDTHTDIRLCSERLLGEIRADKLSNLQRIVTLADYEKKMSSLQAIIDNITGMLREKLKRNISETQLFETIKFLLDTKTQLEDEVNKGKSHFESCNKLMEYFKNQINILEETNTELKAKVVSHKNTLETLYQEKNDLEKYFNEKLATLSAEMSTDVNTEWKAKYEKSEKLVHNYEEQIASLNKIQLQLNNTIEEIEEELQKTYTDREELKTQLDSMNVETKKLRRAMCVNCEESESSESLVHLYNKIISSLKTENQELIEKISDIEEEVLENCNEKENLSSVASELRAELKLLQDSVLEKDAEIGNLKSRLKSKDDFLLEMKAEFEASEAAKLQLNSVFEEVKENLHKMNAEKQSLLQDNENLLSEIETLKQDQLAKDKNTVSNTEILEEEMEKISETCKFLRQCLHEKDEEMGKVVLEKEQLLKDINSLRKEIDISYSREEKSCGISEENKLLKDQVKELECRVIEIEDENLSVYEKLDSMDRGKNEVEKEWLRRHKMYNHKVEALDKKIFKMNALLFKSGTEEQKLHNSRLLSHNLSESSEKNNTLPSESLENVSDLESSWKVINNNFDAFHEKFLDFLKNTESFVGQKNETEQKLSLTSADLERYQCEVSNWRNMHQNVTGFMSDIIIEMCVPKSALKSSSEGDAALSAGVCEANVMKDLHAIKVHLSQIKKENSHAKLKIGQLEKLISELKSKNEEISQDYEAMKQKNLENTSEMVFSQLQIDRLTEDVKRLKKVNSKLEEEVSALHSKVSSLKQKEKDFFLKDDEMRNKVKILSSELTDLLNEKKALEYENNVLAAKFNSRKETDIVNNLEQQITGLKQKLDEYENEINQLKGEKQQYETLQSLEVSDMTVKMPMMSLFSEVKSVHHSVDNSKKTDPVTKSTPYSCDDNLPHEVKSTIATILKILCIENTHLPLNKQLDLIKDKVTSVLENSTTSFQLAKQLCKEIAPSGAEFEGKSPSDLLHTLGSKFKDQQQLISDINRNICCHIQTVKHFLKGVCELLQILRPTDCLENANAFDFGKAFKRFEHAVKGVDANHCHTVLGSVDSVLQNKILPFMHTMKDQGVRKKGAIVSEELMQERQKMIRLETKLDELTKANAKLEGKLRLCLFNAKQMEKSYVSLQQENATLQEQVGHKENVDSQTSNEVKELREKLHEMENKYERIHNELCTTMEKHGNSVQEINDLRSECDWLTANLEHAQRQLKQIKATTKDPVSIQMDPGASSKDSCVEKAVAKEISHIPRRILSTKGNVSETVRTSKRKGESHEPDVELLPRDPPEWD